MSSPDLSEMERVLLYAIARANDFKLGKHSSKHVIKRYYPKELKIGKKTQVFKKLESRGYGRLERKELIWRHPTRGEITWNLTDKGLTTALELKDELEASQRIQ